jgi:hypothetical protein
MEAAYRIDPVRPHLIWLLGTVYLYVGREDEAVEPWKKTLCLPVSPMRQQLRFSY